MSLTMSMPQYSRTSFAMVMFPDNPYRANCIALKQYYLCDTVDEIYLINDGAKWAKVSKEEWLASIHNFCGTSDIEFVIKRLENREACKRIIM
jgi:hypothetical protein